MRSFAFLQGLDRDLQENLLKQLRDLWTHTSTALEGNTLTLGETKFVIEEGLTVSGKPIKDHQEVIGHAKAIEILYNLLDKPVTEQDLFDLHKAVQTEIVSDIYKPHGAWKVEPNGTYAVNKEGKQTFIEYAFPSDVPSLMNQWLITINQYNSENLSLDTVIEAYAKIHMGFVHVHPFWDGNGRIARLLANLPLLKSGHAPMVIDSTNRKEYIEVLAEYQLEIGTLDKNTDLWPDESLLKPFIDFCKTSYQTTLDLIANAKKQQKKRDAKK
ncbi:Fic family protein [Endozoicomonas sp. SM1973]|uniref:Fic family protein n=1 Tax=Spartinivicinus marinus TaxID=2994442 RepID=A0A853I2S0_9GAMM|nr:Fic family protein [Spartinivicinus marinus]MCX4026527.1 Fic family protein [Spartinivicinus marinus]NYZ66899.1 Fic family protein [Spartinivicinus marinus]